MARTKAAAAAEQQLLGGPLDAKDLDPKNPRKIRRARRRQAMGRFWKQYRRSVMGMLGLVILMFFIGMALFAIFFANPAATDPSIAKGPGPRAADRANPLGTDIDGISVLSLVVEGSRTSLFVGLAATVVIDDCSGRDHGMCAGYHGGITDADVDASHRLVPGDPVARARDRARRRSSGRRWGSSS